MVAIIGLRGDEFRYQEEEYNYDLERNGMDHTYLQYTEIGTYYESGPLKIKHNKVSEYPNALVEKGAHWTFKGTGQALSELLTTLSK